MTNPAEFEQQVYVGLSMMQTLWWQGTQRYVARGKQDFACVAHR